MQEGGPASLRNGCLNSSCAVALCEGSRTSIKSKKPRRTEETCNTMLALGADKEKRFQPTLGLCMLFSWEDKGHCELSYDKDALNWRTMHLLRAIHVESTVVQNSTQYRAFYAACEKQ